MRRNVGVEFPWPGKMTAGGTECTLVYRRRYGVLILLQVRGGIGRILNVPDCRYTSTCAKAAERAQPPSLNNR